MTGRSLSLLLCLAALQACGVIDPDEGGPRETYGRLTVEALVFSPLTSQSVGIRNPGHVAIAVGDTIANYGRYWGAATLRPWTGPGVLILDDKRAFVKANLVKRSWISGFPIAGVDGKLLMDELQRLYDGGSPGTEAQPGRQIDEYLMTQRDCKQFVLGLLRFAGLEVPSYFGAMDYPEDTVRDFRAWHQQDPWTVGEELTYE